MPLTLCSSYCETRHTSGRVASCEGRLMSATRALVRALVLALLAAPASAVLASSSRLASFRIATWNLEWLISPPAFKQLKTNCAPEGAPARGDVRQLPCDVAAHLER